jgi:competence protein ComEA
LGPGLDEILLGEKTMDRITRMFVFALMLALSGVAVAEPVDINTADAQALAVALSGVGESKARAIVDYREQNGPFSSAEELRQVRGIGGRILDMNRSNIVVSTRGKSPGQ